MPFGAGCVCRSGHSTELSESLKNHARGRFQLVGGVCVGYLIYEGIVVFGAQLL